MFLEYVVFSLLLKHMQYTSHDKYTLLSQKKERGGRLSAMRELVPAESSIVVVDSKPCQLDITHELNTLPPLAKVLLQKKNCTTHTQ